MKLYLLPFVFFLVARSLHAANLPDPEEKAQSENKEPEPPARPVPGTAFEEEIVTAMPEEESEETSEEVEPPSVEAQSNEQVNDYDYDEKTNQDEHRGKVVAQAIRENQGRHVEKVYEKPRHSHKHKKPTPNNLKAFKPLATLPKMSAVKSLGSFF